MKHERDTLCAENASLRKEFADIETRLRTKLIGEPSGRFHSIVAMMQSALSASPSILKTGVADMERDYEESRKLLYKQAVDADARAEALAEALREVLGDWRKLCAKF